MESDRPEVIERVQTPGGELQLQRRGQDYELISNGVFLMATRGGGRSERALVSAGLDLSRDPQRVLIGGLGVGYSLAAALADPRVASVTVVELEGAVIRWNRDALAPFSDHGLEDPRTRVVCAGLLEWLRQCTDTYDVICVDIDNGPSWTVSPTNRVVYEDTGLSLIKRNLNPGGAVAFWSAQEEPAFSRRLARWFDPVRVLTVPAARGGPDYIYAGRNRP